MAVSNKKKVSILPIKQVETEEISCAPTVRTTPVASSFTLMLEEPETHNTPMLSKLTQRPIEINTIVVWINKITIRMKLLLVKLV